MECFVGITAANRFFCLKVHTTLRTPWIAEQSALAVISQMDAALSRRLTKRHTPERLGNSRHNAAGAAAPSAFHHPLGAPKGLKIWMSLGSNNKAPATAAIIATTVSTPKYRLGVKFDKVSMAKPTTTVSVV